jgi:hypothetical protein
MKAMEILWIMIIFNFVIWMFSFAGIGVGTLSPVAPTDTSPSLLSNIGFLGFIGALSTVSLIVSYFTKQETTQTVLYGIGFAGIFWTTYLKTSSIFISILSSSPYGIGIWSIVSAIVGIVFIIGFIQMSTGGWKYFE